MPMENVVEFLNTTCTLLLSKTQQNLIMGLEPTIILQGVSVFISVMIYMKVFSVNVFKLLRSKKECRSQEQERKKQDRLREVVLAVLQASRTEPEASGEEEKSDVPPFLRRV